MDPCFPILKYGPTRQSVDTLGIMPISQLQIRTDLAVHESLHPYLKIQTKFTVHGSLHPF